MKSIVAQLKAARREEIKVPALVAESLKSRIGVIEENLRDPSGQYGGSQLVGVYGEIQRVIFRKGGVVYEARVSRDKTGKHLIENVKVCDYTVEIEDVAEEVFLTAKAAVNAMLDGRGAEAMEPIAAISRAITENTKVTRPVRLEVTRRALSKTPWYDMDQTVSVDMPSLTYEEEDQRAAMTLALTDLSSFIEEERGEAVTALGGIAEQEFDATATRLTQDVLRDTDRLLRLIEWADRTDAQEMASVLAVVIGRTPSVVRGLKQVAELAAANV